MDFAGDEWRGRVGKGWAAEWERTDRSFAALTPKLLAAVMSVLPSATEQRLQVLDIGCGAGETTLTLADARSDVDVTGVDLSDELIAVAQSRVAGRSNCRFVAADAATWDPSDRFDAALSRHGVMFFADPVAAFVHLRTLMRPGAPLIFSCFRGRAENPWASEAIRLLGAPSPGDPYAPGPFAFADNARVAAILRDAGWTRAQATPLDFDYVAGAGADPAADALSFFSRIGPAAPLIAALPDSARADFNARFADILATNVHNGVVRYPAAAWVWTARA